MFAFTAIDFETTGAVPGLPNEPWQVGLVVGLVSCAVATGVILCYYKDRVPDPVPAELPAAPPAAVAPAA